MTAFGSEIKTESSTIQPSGWVITTEFQPETSESFGFVVMPFSHRKVQVLNIHGQPEEDIVALPSDPPIQVGDEIAPYVIS